MGGSWLGRWRWRRLLLIPALASVHACDCAGCFSIGAPDCAYYPTYCAIGGQCALEGGTCPAHFQLDQSTTCNDAGTFCCNPLPTCSALGGTCEPFCGYGALQGDCNDNSVCCPVLSNGEDASSDALEDAFDGATLGSCNGAPCASGCTCEPSGPEAGGAVCACEATDAGADGESDAASESEGSADGSTPEADADAGTSHGDASEADGSIDVDASNDAVADGDGADSLEVDTAADVDAAPSEAAAVAPCGVIACGTVCTCVSQSMSACVCP
jgi:hypothetical protein